MAGTIVNKSVVKRKKGYLYFIDKDGNVREVKAKKGGTKGAKRCATPKKKKAAASKKRAVKKYAKKSTRGKRK